MANGRVGHDSNGPKSHRRFGVQFRAPLDQISANRGAGQAIAKARALELALGAAQRTAVREGLLALRRIEDELDLAGLDHVGDVRPAVERVDRQTATHPRPVDVGVAVGAGVPLLAASHWCLFPGDSFPSSGR